MKVLVAGSRARFLANPFTTSLQIHTRLAELPVGSVVVHGASPGGGVDQMADRAARGLGLTVIPVSINAQDRRNAVGRNAPILRTLRLLDEHPDLELALVWWDGESPGTRFTLSEVTARRIPVELYEA